MITIDGSQGEGGGQILRTSVGLSLVTGRPIHVENIRARRAKPGLQNQHLVAVKAAAQISKAEVGGTFLGSKALSFAPGPVIPGDYTFAIGTAGSATLVLQTVLPALMTATASSRLVLEGGTHNSMAPPFDFLDRAFLPLLRRMGPRVDATLERRGFYPAGGGRIVVTIEPAPLKRLDLPARGEIRKRRATAIVSRLPLGIARRELAVIGDGYTHVTIEDTTSPGPGNVVFIEIESEHVTEVFTAFGKKGLAAESVAKSAADEAAAYVEADVAVGGHLADQLMIPMAMAGGGSFTSLPLSGHSTTNIDVIRAFLPVSMKSVGSRVEIM